MDFLSAVLSPTEWKKFPLCEKSNAFTVGFSFRHMAFRGKILHIIFQSVLSAGKKFPLQEEIDVFTVGFSFRQMVFRGKISYCLSSFHDSVLIILCKTAPNLSNQYAFNSWHLCLSHFAGQDPGQCFSASNEASRLLQN